MDVVKIGDEICVETPTSEQVRKWMRSNHDSMKEIAKASNEIKIKKSGPQNDFKKKLEKFERTIDLKKKLLSKGRGDQTKHREKISELEQKVKDLKKDLNGVKLEIGKKKIKSN